jgi:hypothetical protein
MSEESRDVTETVPLTETMMEYTWPPKFADLMAKRKKKDESVSAMNGSGKRMMES